MQPFFSKIVLFHAFKQLNTLSVQNVAYIIKQLLFDDNNSGN